METVVADTSALVSLGIPSADSTYDSQTAPDPLRILLTGTSVIVPESVIDELEETAQYSDIHGAAAANVLSAEPHLSIENPFRDGSSRGNRPSLGLDDGETDGIVLANALGADGFLTDEFGSSAFAVIHAALEGARLIPSPRIIRDLALTGVITRVEARELLQRIGSLRSWEGNPYFELLANSLEMDESG